MPPATATTITLPGLPQVMPFVPTGTPQATLLTLSIDPGLGEITTTAPTTFTFDAGAPSFADLWRLRFVGSAGGTVIAQPTDTNPAITTRTIKGDTGTAVFEIADLMSDSVVSTSGAGGAWTFGVGHDAWTKVVTRFTGNDGSKWTRTQEYRDVFRLDAKSSGSSVSYVFSETLTTTATLVWGDGLPTPAATANQSAAQTLSFKASGSAAKNATGKFVAAEKIDQTLSGSDQEDTANSSTSGDTKNAGVTGRDKSWSTTGSSTVGGTLAANVTGSQAGVLGDVSLTMTLSYRTQSSDGSDTKRTDAGDRSTTLQGVTGTSSLGAGTNGTHTTTSQGGTDSVITRSASGVTTVTTTATTVTSFRDTYSYSGSLTTGSRENQNGIAVDSSRTTTSSASRTTQVDSMGTSVTTLVNGVVTAFSSHIDDSGDVMSTWNVSDTINSTVKDNSLAGTSRSYTTDQNQTDTGTSHKVMRASHDRTLGADGIIVDGFWNLTESTNGNTTWKTSNAAAFASTVSGSGTTVITTGSSRDSDSGSGTYSGTGSAQVNNRPTDKSKTSSSNQQASINGRTSSDASSSARSTSLVISASGAVTAGSSVSSESTSWSGTYSATSVGASTSMAGSSTATVTTDRIENGSGKSRSSSSGSSGSDDRGTAGIIAGSGSAFSSSEDLTSTSSSASHNVARTDNGVDGWTQTTSGSQGGSRTAKQSSRSWSNSADNWQAGVSRSTSSAASSDFLDNGSWSWKGDSSGSGTGQAYVTSSTSSSSSSGKTTSQSTSGSQSHLVDNSQSIAHESSTSTSDSSQGQGSYSSSSAETASADSQGAYSQSTVTDASENHSGTTAHESDSMSTSKGTDVSGGTSRNVLESHDHAHRSGTGRFSSASSSHEEIVHGAKSSSRASVWQSVSNESTDTRSTQDSSSHVITTVSSAGYARSDDGRSSSKSEGDETVSVHVASSGRASPDGTFENLTTTSQSSSGRSRAESSASNTTGVTDLQGFDAATKLGVQRYSMAIQSMTTRSETDSSSSSEESKGMTAAGLAFASLVDSARASTQGSERVCRAEHRRADTNSSSTDGKFPIGPDAFAALTTTTTGFSGSSYSRSSDGTFTASFSSAGTTTGGASARSTKSSRAGAGDVTEKTSAWGESTVVSTAQGIDLSSTTKSTSENGNTFEGRYASNSQSADGSGPSMQSSSSSEKGTTTSTESGSSVTDAKTYSVGKNVTPTTGTSHSESKSSSKGSGPSSRSASSSSSTDAKGGVSGTSSQSSSDRLELTWSSSSSSSSSSGTPPIPDESGKSSPGGDASPTAADTWSSSSSRTDHGTGSSSSLSSSSTRDGKPTGSDSTMSQSRKGTFTSHAESSHTHKQKGHPTDTPGVTQSGESWGDSTSDTIDARSSSSFSQHDWTDADGSSHSEASMSSSQSGTTTWSGGAGAKMEGSGTTADGASVETRSVHSQTSSGTNTFDSTDTTDLKSAGSVRLVKSTSSGSTSSESLSTSNQTDSSTVTRSGALAPIKSNTTVTSQESTKGSQSSKYDWTVTGEGKDAVQTGSESYSVGDSGDFKSSADSSTEYTLTRGDKVSGKHTFTGKSSKADTASGTWGSSGSVTFSTDAKPGSKPAASGSITDTMSGKSQQRHSDEVTTTDTTETSYGESSDTRIRTASKIVDRDVSGSTKRVPNADGTFAEQPSTTITTRDSSSSSSTHIHTEGYETPLPGGGTRHHGGTFTDTSTATRGTLACEPLSTGAGSTGGVRTTSTTHDELTYDVTLDASGRATSRSHGERHSSSSTETAAAADGSGGKVTVKQSSSGTLITYAAGPTGSTTITQVSSAGMEKVTGSANTSNMATGGFLGTTTQTLQSQNGSSSDNVTTEISDTTGNKTLVHNANSITWLDGSKLRTRTTAGTADLSQANSSSARTTDSFVDVSLVSSGTSLNLGGWEDSFNVLGDLAGDWAPTVIGTCELIAGFANDPGAAVEVVGAAAVTAGEYTIDAGAGAIDSFVDTLNPFSPWVDIPNIGPVFGHEDAYFVGGVAGTVGGMVAGMSIGNIAAGTSSLVACGSLAQKAAKLYTAIDTVAGIANATSNIAASNASLGDALAFLPVMTVGVQKLRGAPTNCFIAGTLVAVAGVNAGTGTADAGPASASKPIEEIQVGDFVWARAEHDPSAPAVLQKVVALYRNTAHDLQTLEVVGDQGSAETLGQSVQIVATDEHPFYVVDVGWTTADAVQVGQKLLGAAGAVLTVVANRDWKPDGGVVVYNFQVEGDHTYFVGDIHAQGEWVWTHNACTSTFELPKTWKSAKGVSGTFSDGKHSFRLDTHNLSPGERFHVHVYSPRGKEIAVVQGAGTNGIWRPTHRGSTLLKPSEVSAPLRTDIRRLLRNALNNLE